MKSVVYEAHTERQPLKAFAAADTTKHERLSLQTPRHVVFVGSGSTSGFQLLDRDAWGVAAVAVQSFNVGFRSDNTQTGFFHNPADFDISFRMKIEEAVAKRVQKEKNRRAIDLLRSWLNADEIEARDQKETFEFLSAVLDQDRHSGRKLFP